MKPLVLISIAIGILLILLGVYYFVTPANQLPTFIPGSDHTDTSIHYKHGLASILLGAAALIFAWFQTGKKSSASPTSNQ